jgi:hypothetical protein
MGQWSAGLTVFMLVGLVDTVALLFDVYLMDNEGTSITAFCRGHWWAGAVLVFWQLLGVGGLCSHFWLPSD